MELICIMGKSRGFSLKVVGLRVGVCGKARAECVVELEGMRELGVKMCELSSVRQDRMILVSEGSSVSRLSSHNSVMRRNSI